MFFNKDKQTEQSAIGEVLTVCYDCYNPRLPLHGFLEPRQKECAVYFCNWHKFTYNDIDFGKSHDEFLYIFGNFHKRENVIFYTNVYDAMRQEVEKKIKDKNLQVRK